MMRSYLNLQSGPFWNFRKGRSVIPYFPNTTTFVSSWYPSLFIRFFILSIFCRYTKYASCVFTKYSIAASIFPSSFACQDSQAHPFIYMQFSCFIGRVAGRVRAASVRLIRFSPPGRAFQAAEFLIFNS